VKCDLKSAHLQNKFVYLRLLVKLSTYCAVVFAALKPRGRFRFLCVMCACVQWNRKVYCNIV
uniref:Uncharacterized protein n=1 Tax=Anopheles atroparvus TaxID=41427 RepID=A0AAG5DR96_ANOAO